MSCSSYDEAAPPPATADAGTVDGGEAGSDSSGPIDAGNDARGPFCASFSPAPLFCADFDEGKPFNYGFTDFAGDFAIDPTTFTSPPSSLLVRGVDGGDVFMVRSVDALTTTSLHLGFSIRWGTDDAGPPPGGIPMRLNDSAVNDCSFFFIKVRDGAWFVEIDANRPDAMRTQDAYAMPLFPVDRTWSRVELVVEQTSPDVVSASVIVDGQISVSPKATDCRGLGHPEVTVGAQYSTSGTLDLDDVVLTQR